MSGHAETVKVKRSTIFKISIVAALLVLSLYLLLSSIFGQSQNIQNQNNADVKALQQTYNSLSPTGKRLFYQQSDGLTKEVDPRLVYLDNLTISCGGISPEQLSAGRNPGASCVGPGNMLSADGNVVGPNLGGQCCGALTDVSKYERHLENMKKYSWIPDSPPDHFNVSVELARKLIAYDYATTLTPKQQKIYDDAVALSEEGPCCCRCWHWYANSGLAKEFIIKYNFTAEQVADYWDESDICG